MSSSAPLGVFDSGLGGLTVVRALREALAFENIVYLGDTARVPYGTRSAETVIRYARGCARVLIERSVKALVVACNTVSAVALDVLRAEFDLPIVGVVEPGAFAAVAAAEAAGLACGVMSNVGVLGTPGTIASLSYPRAVARLTTRFEVIGRAAPLLVPLVEEGWLDGDVPTLAVRRYLEPLIQANVGVIVLGCTHYPLLKSTIARVAAELAGRDVPIVDSAVATAQEVVRMMADGRIARNPADAVGELRLLVTDLPESFHASARRFLGQQAPAVTAIDLPPG